MKRERKDLMCLAGALVLILSAVPALAQPFGPGFKDPEAWKERREARMRVMEEQLNLSPEQKQLLEAHRTKHREEAQLLHKEIKARKDAIRIELEKPDLDTGKIRKLNSELKGLVAKSLDRRLEGILEVRKIMSAEQFAQFMELTRKHRGGPGMGMMSGPPAPPEDSGPPEMPEEPGLPDMPGE